MRDVTVLIEVVVTQTHAANALCALVLWYLLHLMDITYIGIDTLTSRAFLTFASAQIMKSQHF